MDDLIERLDRLIEKQRNARGDYLFKGEADPELIDARARIATLEALVKEAGEALHRARYAIETLADNDLDEPIADNGMTVGSKLQYDAPALVLYICTTLARIKENSRGD